MGAVTAGRADLLPCLVLELLEAAWSTVDLRLLHARALGSYQILYCLLTGLPGSSSARGSPTYHLISVHSPHVNIDVRIARIISKFATTTCIQNQCLPHP